MGLEYAKMRYNCLINMGMARVLPGCEPRGLAGNKFFIWRFLSGRRTGKIRPIMKVPEKTEAGLYRTSRENYKEIRFIFYCQMQEFSEDLILFFLFACVVLNGWFRRNQHLYQSL